MIFTFSFVDVSQYVFLFISYPHNFLKIIVFLIFLSTLNVFLNVLHEINVGTFFSVKGLMNNKL